MCLETCHNCNSLITMWWCADNSPQYCFSCLLSPNLCFNPHECISGLVCSSSCCSHWEACLYPFICSIAFVLHLLKSALQFTEVWGRTWLSGDDKGKLGTLTWHLFSWDWHSEKSIYAKSWGFRAEREVITYFALKKKGVGDGEWRE